MTKTKTYNLLLAASVLALSLSGCGKVVQSGTTGIKTRSFGSSAGVDPNPLPLGYNMTGIGEDIIIYPTKVHTYQFQGDKAIPFSDKNGVAGLSGDVNLYASADAKHAPELYLTYREDFADLVDNQVRNDVKTFIAQESEKMSVDQMVGPNREAIIEAADVKLQAKWAPQGVTVHMTWLGNLHYPQVMEDAIIARTKADQEVAAAEAQQRVATAQAATKIAVAQGDAESTRIRGEALRANPQVLRQMEIDKWDGQLPSTYAGGNAPFILNTPSN